MLPTFSIICGREPQETQLPRDAALGSYISGRRMIALIPIEVMIKALETHRRAWIPDISTTDTIKLHGDNQDNLILLRKVQKGHRDFVLAHYAL